MREGLKPHEILHNLLKIENISLGMAAVCYMTGSSMHGAGSPQV